MPYPKQELQTSNLANFNVALASQKTQAMVTTALKGEADAYFRNIASLVANDPKLQTCTPVSLICGGLQAAQLKLPMGAGLGFAYLIPYNNTKAGVVEAQFQMGYKGLVQLAVRSGMFADINCGEVYEGELKNYNKLSGKFSLDGEKKSDKVIGYFAMFRLNNAPKEDECFQKSLYMTKEEVQKHALTYSQTYKSTSEYVRSSSKWSTDFDAMAKKTVLKLLLSRWAPMSVDIQKALSSDQAIIREEGVIDYVDNQAQPTTSDEQINKAAAHAEAMRAMARASALAGEAPEEQDQESKSE